MFSVMADNPLSSFCRCALFCLATVHKSRGLKTSELNVDGVKLIKLNRAIFECFITQPNISM